MARIIYSLSGDGRGHASRVMTITRILRKKGHEIRFCCGGTSKKIFDQIGEKVIYVPSTHSIMVGNRVLIPHTAQYNFNNVVLRRRKIYSRLADEFKSFQPDLLINDFEFFTDGAAKYLKLPVISLNHQQIVTETRYTLPLDHWYDAIFTGFFIKFIAPKNPDHIIVSSFFFPPIKNPIRTSLIPPIIRPEVQAVTPHTGTSILVYFNHPQGAEHILDILKNVKADFIVYNFPPPREKSRYPNLVFKKPSIDGFLYDLADCRAIICTAGFTLISEALYLKKPLLAIPNGGIFEQILNAFFLQKHKLGEAVINRPIHLHDIEGFLNRLDSIKKRLNKRLTIGNIRAVSLIERILYRLKPKLHPVSVRDRTKAPVLKTKTETTSS